MTAPSFPPAYRAVVLQQRPDARIEEIRRGQGKIYRVIDRKELLGEQYWPGHASAWRAAYRKLNQGACTPALARKPMRAARPAPCARPAAFIAGTKLARGG